MLVGLSCDPLCGVLPYYLTVGVAGASRRVRDYGSKKTASLTDHGPVPRSRPTLRKVRRYSARTLARWMKKDSGLNDSIEQTRLQLDFVRVFRLGWT